MPYYGLLTIYHTDTDIVTRLTKAFKQPSNPDVVKNSPLFGANESWARLVSYAIEIPGSYRVIMLEAQGDQLQIHVEPMGSEVRVACENVWRSVRRATGRGTNLSRLEVRDGDGRTIGKATTGWRSALAVQQLWPAILALVAAVAVLGLTLAFFGVEAFETALIGAASILVAGLFVIGWLIQLRTKLVWSGTWA